MNLLDRVVGTEMTSMQNGPTRVSASFSHAGCRSLLLLALFSIGTTASTAIGQAPTASGQTSSQSVMPATGIQSGAPQSSTTGIEAPIKTQLSQQVSSDTQNNVQGNDAKANVADVSATTPTPISTPELTAFQRLAQETLGRPIPIYGQTLFANPKTYAALPDTQATADYVVSTGDEVIVHVWGAVQIDANLPVDRGGNIYIPRVGEVHVAGYRYQDLDTHIREAIGQIFHNVNIAVDLGHLRSIQIFMTGMAAHPGTYVVSSLSTLINALFATGGPAPMGSYRHIQLHRGNSLVTELDLYELIIHGDKSKDVHLLPGDVIYIPPVGNQIAVGGGVKEPAIYELLQSATVRDAIQMAGGVVNTADEAVLQLERIVDHDHREAHELQLPAEANFGLKDGDVIVVGRISPRFDKTVTIRGNLLSPGRFAWHPGMKLSEIIPNKDSLLTAGYWEFRNAEGNPSIPHAPFATHVELPAPEINWSYALIERTDLPSLRNQLIAFNLGKLVLNHDPTEDRELLPGDVITIFSQNDIHVPISQQTRFVRLEGEVVNAGYYPIKPNDTLQSVIVRAGGLTPEAYLYATELVRVAERQRQQQQLNAYVRKLSRESTKSATNVALNAGSASNAQGTLANLQTQFLLQLQTEPASGRVSLNIDHSATDTGNLPSVLLEDGDIVTVPSIGSTVDIIGSVYNPNLYLFSNGKSVKYYLEHAGGADRDSDTKHMFVLRANGTVVSREQEKEHFSKLQLFPGDALVVPAKLFSISKMRLFLDSLNSYGQLGLVAALAVK